MHLFGAGSLCDTGKGNPNSLFTYAGIVYCIKKKIAMKRIFQAEDKCKRIKKKT